MVDKAYDKIEVEEPMQVVSPKSGQPISCKNTCIKTSIEKKQWQVMVIGDSLLRGTEAPICRPYHLFREVSCLPGAWNQGWLTSLVQPLDYYLLLLFHVGTNDIATKSLRSIEIFKDPGKNAKKFRSTGSIFLNPPSNGEKLQKKPMSWRHQYLSPGLVPLPELWGLWPWKSLLNTWYAGSWWDPPVPMGETPTLLIRWQDWLRRL